MRPLSLRLCCMLLCLFAFSAQAAVNTFWSQPQRGGNSFNEQPPDRAYFDALRATGATWVRLTPDKWRSAGGRDFLMGNADRYQGLVRADVATLRRVLDDADAAGIKVVLVPLSLPLLRWKQKNGGVVDQRLWQSFDNHRPAQAFWRDLARALHGHPALVAYNLINEPAPEYGTPLREHADPAAMRAWYATVKDGPRDLPRFYTGLIAAVREVDADMPLMLDPGWYAAADALAYWPAPLKDPHLLYSVHMYEPYAATSAPNQKRATPYRYPAVVPFGPGKTQWDANRVASYLQQPLAWADEHGVARSQMVVGEFGCMRRWPDCPAYLEDALRVLEAQKVHWAFYAFREDAWDGMDYELGDAALPWTYWRDVEAGKVPTPMRTDSPQFAPILKRLRAADR
jgi:hypothetical protein